MLAVRQVETFDGADPLEEVEGAEDGGPPDGGPGAWAAVTSSAAVKWPSCSAISAASARRGSVDAVAGAVEGGHDRGRVAHGGRLAQLRRSLISRHGPSMGRLPARS